MVLPLDEQIEMLLEKMDASHVPACTEIDYQQYRRDFNIAFDNLVASIEASGIENKGELAIRCGHIGVSTLEAIRASENERPKGNNESKPDFTVQIEELKDLRDSLVSKG